MIIKESINNKFKIRKKIISAVLIVLLILALCIPAMACSGKSDNKSLIEKIQYGMVEIEALNTNGGAKTYGSGFIISVNIPESESESEEPSEGSCVIITNYHVTQNLYPSVRFFGEEDFTPAILRGYDQEFDVSVLIVNRLPDNYHVFSFGGATALGEDVVSLGYVSHRLSAYNGIVSVKDKWIRSDNKDRYVFETTAAAPFGTSGGPCVDKKGNLIGITSYNYTLDGLLGGVSYKTPAPIISAIYTRIMDSSAAVSNPALGFDVYNDYITVTAFGSKGIFDICLTNIGTLKIGYSDNTDFAVGAKVVSVNGKEVDFCNLIAEIILTGEETEIIIE